MVIWHILITFIVVVVLAIVINGIEEYGSKNSLTKLSFADYMGRLNLPIITLTNNGQTFNFLVDTGASISVVDSIVLDKIEHTKLNTVGEAYGIDGNIVKVNYVSIELAKEDMTFTEQFQVMRLDAFDNLKETDNLELSGILGSAFLKAHGFVIDFEKLTLCTKEVQK